MSEFVINCPKCGKGLKLRDRSKLGKKAGCPKCNHVFVLQMPEQDDSEEDEIQFELANDSAQGQTLDGTGARWIPDSPVAAAQKATAPNKSSKSKSAARPAPVARHVPDEEDPVQEEFNDEPPSRAAKLAKKQMPKLPKISLSRKQRTRLISAVATIVVIVGGVWAAMNAADSKPVSKRNPKVVAGRDKVDPNAVEEEEEDDSEVATEQAQSLPISLWGLPMGARVIVSLRPSELWEAKSKGEEVRFCLGPMGSWADAQLKHYGRIKDLTKIEHMLIALIPGKVGDAPSVATVVRFKEAIPNSTFINDFGGNKTDTYGYPVYVDDKIAMVRKPNDAKTIAVFPMQFAEDVATSAQNPSSAQSDGIDALIGMTDETRHLTVIFEPISVNTHAQYTFGDKTQQLVHKFMDHFDELEIETVAWSMHFGKDKFDSKVLMRNKPAISESRLDKAMRKKVEDLPMTLWKDVVDKMDPTISGHRKIIGRFPAMMKMFAKSTKGSAGTRFTVLETSLTERAAPNIALGALLTWDQSLVTDFNAGPNKGSSGDEKLPDLVIDRLKRKIDIEFARAPLQDAFKYIAEECKTGHDIDGDALKDKGYTKNMPQTFTMQDTGLAAIKKIVSAYPNMCLVIDEQKKEFLITTTTFAEKKNQKVYEFK